MNYTVEQHIALRRVSAIAASPCGTWLAVAVQRLDRDGARYVGDLWRLPTDGTAATQLTRGDSNDTAPAFRNDGSLAFLSNRAPTDRKPEDDDDQRNQVWLLPAAGGEPRQLTDEPLGLHTFRCARRADRLAYFAPVLLDVAADQQREGMRERRKKGPSARFFSHQPVRHWDHWLHDNPDLPRVHLITCNAEGGDRQDLTPGVRGDFAIEPELDISADGRRVVATRRERGRDREDDVSILVIDLHSGTRTLLGLADGALHDGVRFSPDGGRLATVRAIRSAQVVVRPTLMVIDLASGVERALARDWDHWPNLCEWSAAGDAVLVTADDHGAVPIFAIDAAQGAVTRLTAAAAGGSHADIAVLDAERVACIRSTLRHPPEVHLLDARAAAAPRPLARLSGFDAVGAVEDWCEVDAFTVPSTDGAPIHSLVTRPRQATGGSPTLLWIHGGPIGMSADGWHWRWNPLLAVAAGYVVVQPNPRGSTGYGQPFVQGVWGNVWGAQCYQDLMAVTDALAARPEVDATRLVAMGGSFGGYMTNWIGTQTDRFRALVTHASIVGMSTFTGVTDHPAWWYLEMGGENPYQHADRFDRYAPWRYLPQWKSPVLIVHGEQDYRCPIGEALQLFEALKFHGVDAELMVFPDENHWILKPRNVVAWYDAVLGFIGRQVGGQ